LVTDDGRVYSWGRNDDGFLGREVRMNSKIATQDRDKYRKEIQYTTKLPGLVTDLERYHVKSIRVMEGKVMAFLEEQLYMQGGHGDDSAEADSDGDDSEAMDKVANMHEDLTHKYADVVK